MCERACEIGTLDRQRLALWLHLGHVVRSWLHFQQHLRVLFIAFQCAGQRKGRRGLDKALSRRPGLLLARQRLSHACKRRADPWTSSPLDGRRAAATATAASIHVCVTARLRRGRHRTGACRQRGGHGAVQLQQQRVRCGEDADGHRVRERGRRAGCEEALDCIPRRRKRANLLEAAFSVRGGTLHSEWLDGRAAPRITVADAAAARANAPALQPEEYAPLVQASRVRSSRRREAQAAAPGRLAHASGRSR